MTRSGPRPPGHAVSTGATGCHPYCVVPGGHTPPPDLRGLGGSPVELLAAGSLALWVSRIPRPGEPLLEALREHHAVVEAGLSDTVTPLPVRFGAWAGDPGELLEVIRSREDALRSGLERLAGHVELGVRILEPGDGDPRAEPEGDPGDAPSASDPGRSYLEGLARRQRRQARTDERRDEVTAALRETLGSAVLGEDIRTPGGGGLASVAHLVARDAVSDYRRGVEAFQRSRPELRVVMVGPWPPYSFGP